MQKEFKWIDLVIFSLCTFLLLLFTFSLFNKEKDMELEFITSKFLVKLDNSLDFELSECDCTEDTFNITYENGVEVSYYVKPNATPIRQELVITGENALLENKVEDILMVALDISNTEEFLNILNSVKETGIGEIDAYKNYKYRVSFTNGELSIKLTRE